MSEYNLAIKKAEEREKQLLIEEINGIMGNEHIVIIRFSAKIMRKIRHIFEARKAFAIDFEHDIDHNYKF